jgi:spore coat polysaccharide biosynthesis protein SpsF
MDNFKIIIQARMGSTRLPGKMLLPINNKPMLLYLLDRLSKVYTKDTIIVATSLKVIDNDLYDLCIENGYNCFRGSEHNVYSRFKDISELNLDVKHMIRLTGDNPFINLSLIQNILDFHLTNNSIFSSTREITNQVIKRYSPKGQTVDIINVKGFDYISDEELSDYDKEHVIPIFYRKFQYNIFKPENIDRLFAISIDEYSDYEKIKYIEN